MENQAGLRAGSLPSAQRKERRVNGDNHRSVLKNISNVSNVIQSSPSTLLLGKRRQSTGNPEKFFQQSSPAKRLSLNRSAALFSKNDLPVPIKPPFLYRNHIGYKILLTDGTINDVKDAVSDEAQTESFMYRKMCRRITKAESSKRLENSIVQIKKRALAEFSSEGDFVNDILVFEFFKIVSTFDVIIKSECNIYICGVFNGVTKFKQKLSTCLFEGNENRQKSSFVVEFIPPNPSLKFDELYLYVEAKHTIKIMGKKGSSSSNTDVSFNLFSIQSNHFFWSSSETLSYGAYCFSTKQNKPKIKEESPWLTSFKKTGIQLINADKETVNSNDLVKLFKHCQTREREGGNVSLSFEISNENGYGCMDIEKIKKCSELLKKRKQNAKPVNDKDIIYDVKQLIEAKCSLRMSSYVPTSKFLKSRGQTGLAAARAVLKDPTGYHNQHAHEKGTRTFKCLFCAKTFPNYDLLKFHLEHSYPSFTFTFMKTVIKISYDFKSIHDAEKLKKKTFTEQLFKNRISPPLPLEPNSLVVHKRLVNFPYKVYSRYSEVSAPVPGLYGHEISTQFIHQAVKIRLHEFIDVEDQEKAFYYLWNAFNAERSNRRIGMLSLYDRLLAFIQRNFEKIEKFNLKAVWNIFLLYFKNNGILNEKQFFTLSFYGGKFQNKWFGCKAPIVKM
uniref:Polycomb protein VEFS-Box domain-containing protein n=1 Tax=Panagrolaimus sp. PS1159 TaxID=55785 RepID=A0AC35EX21_9BILA